MKGMILLASHFEDTEAIVTMDLIKRAGIEMDAISVVESLDLTTQYGLSIRADKSYRDIEIDQYDFVVLPGGKAVFETHLNSVVTQNIIRYFSENKRLIAAICAAPGVLGQMGLLQGLPYTCFPSCEKYGKDGIYQENQSVVVTDAIITAQAAGATFLFAYEIIKKIKGEQAARAVLDSIYYLPYSTGEKDENQ